MSHILHAVDVRHDGSTLRGDGVDRTVATRTDDESIAYRWIHCDLDHPDTRDWLGSCVDEIVTDALMLEDTQPRCTGHGPGLLINLRGVNLNPESEPEDMVSIRLWAEPGLVISVRRRRLMAVVSLREAMERSEAPTSIGDFLETLTAGLTVRMGPVVTGLADRLDEIETQGIDATEALRGDLADLRRTTIQLRRYIAPQRDALERLRQDPNKLLSDANRVALRETADQLTRMVEEFSAVRERALILTDQLSDLRAEAMNKTMLILSIVAAIFLPLSFLTGLMGVNLAGIPGAGHAAAFTVFCLFLVLLGAGLTWWIRTRNWS